MKGYKVFNPDWTCRGFRYKVGKTYKISEDIAVCERGFHFCEKLIDCFSYYSFDPKNKVAEVEALGVVLKEDRKSCTNKIHIIRELSWYEVLNMVNTGVGNAGIGNAGNDNSLNYNKGNRNSGCNNLGSYNSGDYNVGNYNADNYNKGDHNSGLFNIGGYNAGVSNNGNNNTGCCNIGNYNAGDCNIGNYNTGVFCTGTSFVNFFDSPSDWTIDDWKHSHAYNCIAAAPALMVLKEWSEMSDSERQAYPEAEVMQICLIARTHNEMQELTQSWWDDLYSSDRDAIRSLPNFDAAKFERIMWGIDISEKPEPDDGGFTIDSVSGISVEFDNGTVVKWEWDNTET